MQLRRNGNTFAIIDGNNWKFRYNITLYGKPYTDTEGKRSKIELTIFHAGCFDFLSTLIDNVISGINDIRPSLFPVWISDYFPVAHSIKLMEWRLQYSLMHSNLLTVTLKLTTMQIVLSSDRN